MPEGTDVMCSAGDTVGWLEGNFVGRLLIPIPTGVVGVGAPVGN